MKSDRVPLSREQIAFAEHVLSAIRACLLSKKFSDGEFRTPVHSMERYHRVPGFALPAAMHAPLPDETQIRIALSSDEIRRLAVSMKGAAHV